MRRQRWLHACFQQLPQQYHCTHAELGLLCGLSWSVLQEFGKTKVYLPKQDGLEVLSKEASNCLLPAPVFWHLQCSGLHIQKSSSSVGSST